MEIMQAQMQEKVEKLQGLQKTQQKTLMARQTLDSQISENKLVKDELDGLEEDAKVFKLIGPALIRQTNIKKPLVLWLSVSTNFLENWLSYIQFKVPISAETKKQLHFDGFFYSNFYVNEKNRKFVKSRR